MRKQDYLSNLINALTPNEKRYFKLNARLQTGSKNYMKLYEIMENEDRYDVSHICKKLKITPKKLADEKDYLQQVLLRTLRSFNDDTPGITSLYQTLIDITVLCDKKQFDFALSLVRKTLPIAEANEHNDVLLSLARLEMQIMNRMKLYYTDPDSFTPVIERAIQVAQKEEAILVYADLRRRMIAAYDEKSYRSDPKYTEEMDSIMQHPYLKDRSMIRSFAHQMMYCDILFLYHMSRVEWQAAAEAVESGIALMEQYPHKIYDNTERYFALLNNVMTAYEQVKRYDDVLATADRMERILTLKGITIPQSLSSQIYEEVLLKRMGTYLAVGQYDKTIEQYDISEQAIKKGLVPSGIVVYRFRHLWVATAYLHLRQYDEALRHIRIFIDEATAIPRPDEMLYGYMLHIMIHYELKNYQILPYQIDSLKRFVKTRDIKGKSVPLFLQLFSRLARGMRDQEALAVISEYAPRFHELNKMPEEDTILEWSSLMTWLKHKVHA